MRTGRSLGTENTDTGNAAKLMEHPDLLVAVAGGWLVVAPLLLDHDAAATTFARWSDVVAGSTLILFALVRMIRPVDTAGLSLASSGLGVWLIAAPFVGDYTTAMHATLNDLVVGLLVIMFAGVSWGIARLGRRRRVRSAPPAQGPRGTR